jgi:NAD(P)-dependent dehydrogenase (short-subunit alcohol dehydrogenase family)
MSFAERTVLITGAASGIGLATARHLEDAGARRLLLVDRTGDALQQLDFACDSVRLVGDVADSSFWADANLGSIDHAVINAGVSGVSPIADMPFEEWRRVMSTNLDGAFLGLQAALRAIKDG